MNFIWLFTRMDRIIFENEVKQCLSKKKIYNLIQYGKLILLDKVAGNSNVMVSIVIIH